MSRPITLTLTETLVTFKGNRDALTALRRHGMRPVAARGRWMLDRTRHRVDRVADITAVLEHAGFTVELEGVLPRRVRADRGLHAGEDRGGVNREPSNSTQASLW